MVRTNAAALIIGNEILTGKVREANIFSLAQFLFARGVQLEHVRVVPDDIDTIAQHLNSLKKETRWIFTSGGVGVTHDDVTLAAVAKAFGRKLYHSEEMESSVRALWGSNVTPRHLQMSLIPEGARLIREGSNSWPILAMENVFVMPGVPDFFARKLHLLESEFAGHAPFFTRAVLLRCDEPDIADILEKLAQHHPQLRIGSYPQWTARGPEVKVTFDGTDDTALEQARTELVTSLPSHVALVE